MLLKVFIIAGDSSSQSVSKTIGCFLASSISLNCSFVNGWPGSRVNVLIIRGPPLWDDGNIAEISRASSLYFV